MSNPETYPLPEEGEPESEGIKALRADRDAKAAEAAAGRAAQRELAMLKAGVDTDTPVGKLFMQAYDGDLDPDAIKAQWAELNPTSPPEPPAPEGPSESEARRLLTQGPGVTPETLLDEKPRTIEDAFEEFRSLKAQGHTERDASIAVFGQFFSEAAAGTGHRWDQEAIAAHQAAAKAVSD